MASTKPSARRREARFGSLRSATALELPRRRSWRRADPDLSTAKMAHFVFKRRHISKCSVDRRKADIRHLIELAEFVHRQIADDGARDFGRIARTQVGLDLLDRALDGLGADGALGARHLQAATQLVGVPLLAALVALDDHE